MKKRPGTQISLQQGLNRFSRQIGKRGAYTQVRISAAWEEIAGETVVSHTTGAHLRGGELVVYVDEPAWANDLTALSEQYRTALNSNIGQELIKSVRFTVSHRVAEEFRFIRAEQEQEAFYRPDSTPPVPLTPIEVAQVEDSASEIPDAQVREAVIKATIAGLAWKKGQDKAKRLQNPS